MKHDEFSLRQRRKNFAFIDGNNLHLGIRDQGWKLDYKRFRIYLTEKYDVIRAYMFMGFVPEQEKLYRLLESWGYVLIFKTILRDAGRTVKGNCDTELVLQAMIDLQHYHQAVIITGDGDFSCLVSHLKEHGKLRCLLAPDYFHHSRLLNIASGSHIAFLNDLRGDLAYQKGTPVGRDREGGLSS